MLKESWTSYLMKERLAVGVRTGFQDQHAFCTAEQCLANFPF